MIIYPAIDLKNGRVVRLEQGRADRETIYGDDPGAQAEQFRAAGAAWIHVVDLDGAFAGQPANRNAVREIIRAGLKVELGGGIRSLEAIREALADGVSRVVVGTRAAVDPDFLKAIFAEFSAEQVAIGIDARDGKVAIKGWVDILDLTAIDLAWRVADVGGRYVVYTDISRDGMLGGPNLSAQEEMCRKSGLEIIASGGVGSVEDVHALRQLKSSIPNLDGVIIGKALYDGRIQLAQALEAARWRE